MAWRTDTQMFPISCTGRLKEINVEKHIGDTQASCALSRWEGIPYDRLIKTSSAYLQGHLLSSTSISTHRKKNLDSF